MLSIYGFARERTGSEGHSRRGSATHRGRESGMVSRRGGRCLRRSVPIRVGWIEEPVAGNRLADLGAPVQATAIPIAIGENLYCCQEFVDYAESASVTILQPDVSKAGGIAELDSICSLATKTKKVVVPHWYGGAVRWRPRCRWPLYIG